MTHPLGTKIIGRLQLDYFVISETKLDSSFPSVQFYLRHYETRNRSDRNKSGCGLFQFVKKGIIAKRLKYLKTNLDEKIYRETSEITKSKKRWFCISVYRQPSF